MGTTIATLGNESYGDLLPASGRAALRATLLGNYQKILGTSEGAQVVSGVYFTSFVLQ
jgi:flagellar basal body-associated protein FliL